MLVLSRKKNESIIINNDITVTVVEIRGDKVRLGIDAPQMVPVHRQEVWVAIQAENAAKVPNATIPDPATPAAAPMIPESLHSTFPNTAGGQIDAAH